ncbi:MULTISPECIES: hypothetical protein [Pseudomonas]|uniref:DUF4148 domain-containing protein n=1 Tax=Pseudomonas eucalypticola TaxID=2599595 RepID=A0A7D5H639_9PSED|nr:MULTISPECIES: hypothetical protein [Pseudomonas]QKZ04823.1 hypothetical protein HWQ56_13895 [Pseudomonas eucalypticola]
MKPVLTFTLAMSLLATGSAFATPQTVTSHERVTVAQDGAEHARNHNLRTAQAGSEAVQPRQHMERASVIYVAEVRKEFGSQYQRY